MSIIRDPHTKDFTVISNDCIRQNLSLAARGLLLTVFSLPDNWSFSVRGLCSVTGAGEYTVRKLLKELQSGGYLEIRTLYPSAENGGVIRHVYSFSKRHLQHSEFQTYENQAAEHPPLLNKKTPIKKRKNTDISKRIEMEKMSEDDFNDFFKAAVRRSYCIH